MYASELEAKVSDLRVRLDQRLDDTQLQMALKQFFERGFRAGSEDMQQKLEPELNRFRDQFAVLNARLENVGTDASHNKKKEKKVKFQGTS